MRTVRAGTVHVLTVDEPFGSESSQARAGVTALRGGLVARSVDGITGAEWAVGGDAATNMDYDTHSSDRLPWVIACPG